MLPPKWFTKVKIAVSHDYHFNVIAMTNSSADMNLWGRGMWQPRPISYQAQGPRWGRRNIQGWTKKVQAARRCCRGQPCPQRTEVTEGENGTLSRTASPGILNKKTNTVGQLWGHGGGAILGEAVTSALNACS